MPIKYNPDKVIIVSNWEEIIFRTNKKEYAHFLWEAFKWL